MAEMTDYLHDVERAAALVRLQEEGAVLITGATGLIGGCLVDMLMRHSRCIVYATGRDSQRARRRFDSYWQDGRFHFLQHDVCQPLPLDIPIPYIIHAASNASPNAFRNTPVEVMKANLDGLCRLVEYGLAHDLRSMVYVSSGEVYGEGDGGVFTEQSGGYIDIMSPRSCYPSAKRAAETLCAAYVQEYGAHIVTARPCHTYGPYFTESDNRVYAQFIRNVLGGEDIIMKSQGRQCRSWLYVVDCATALLHLLTTGQSGEAYNVANDTEAITIRQLAETTAAIAGRRVVLSPEADADTSPISRAVFSADKLRATGWQPLFNLEEGLHHTISALR